MTSEKEAKGAVVAAWLQKTTGTERRHLIGCIVDDNSTEDDWYVLNVNDDLSLQLSNGTSERRLPLGRLRSAVVISQSMCSPLFEHINASQTKEPEFIQDARNELKQHGLRADQFNELTPLLAAARVLNCCREGGYPSLEDGRIIKSFCIPRMQVRRSADTLFQMWIQAREKTKTDPQARLTYATYLRKTERPRDALGIIEAALIAVRNDETDLLQMLLVCQASCLLDLQNMGVAEKAINKALALGKSEYAEKVWHRLHGMKRQSQ